MTNLVPTPQAVLSVEEMYAADRAAAALGIPTLTLMEAAGTAIAREIQKRWKRQNIVILCGPGNNGGDGFVVARLLFNAGWPVKVALLDDAASLKGDAGVNAQAWRGMGGLIAPITADTIEALLAVRPMVLDALFGAGLNRGLSGDAARVITRINELQLICIAVDVPSGVHGDRGVVLPADLATPGVAPACALTVTFFKPKPAHVLYPARQLCGALVVADIGIPDDVLDTIKPAAWVNSTALWSLPHPDWQSHKYKRGHGLIFGGADMTGASRLAGHAARKAGAGLLTYAVPARAFGLYAGDQPGAFVKVLESSADLDDILSDHRKNAILIGPGAGVGASTSALTLKVLGTNRPLVLDADALTSFAADPPLLFEAIKSRTAGVVLTPHEAEFRRLFAAKGSKIDQARKAAQLSGAVVLLKGADTVVAAPDGRVAINTIAAPWLATGGSGDVLAGLILGLLAQGMTPWHAAAAAAWIHAKAGETLGAGLIAETLTDTVGDVIKSIL
ncbi:MAG: NAD(P)H-hydrate dehydratase [Rhodospirillaceae bacterium]|nr:NAD(P)H-hydrate dehydratase [Rhodospirillaceae bacterium]